MTQLPYPKYKNSGIGWLGDIPEHWNVWRFSHLFRSGMGETILKEQLLDEGSLPVFSATELNTVFGYVESARVILKPGDLIIPARGNSIGHTKEVTSRCTTTQTTIFAKKSNSNVLTRFAFYFLNAYRPVLFFFDRTAIPQITVDDVSRNPVIVPCEEEQRVIVNFLDRETVRIEELIEKKQRQIELLQEKRSALISHAVTKGLDPNAKMKDSGVEWLGDIPEHWEVRRIKYMARILRGKFTHRPRNDPRMYDGPYPFIQTGDVAGAAKYIREHSQTLSADGFAVSKMFPKGTLVMTIAANIGDMAILNFEACFPDSIVGFVPNRDVSLDFLYYLFVGMRQELMGTATLNTQLNLNIDRIGSLLAVQPPVFEQKQIFEYLENRTGQISQLVDRIKGSIIRLNEYRSAIISAAVTGKIDVREEAA
jgi:type I restriction enzyme, S subunit